MIDLRHGDCLEVLRGLADNSIDSLVTDPPAGIAFMGREWDRDKGGRDGWVAWLESIMRECLRVLKPGAHGLVWALPRTAHWTAFALENAGFEIRDCVTHLFGSGFPKSLNVSKAIDKAAGATREVVGTQRLTGHAALSCEEKGGTYAAGVSSKGAAKEIDITAPATDDAKAWEGWGTALKPAAEFWWLVRKPLDGTVAANVTEHGVGAINVGACRVEGDGGGTNRPHFPGPCLGHESRGRFGKTFHVESNAAGRWPANLVLTHGDCGAECADDCPVRALDEQAGELQSNGRSEQRISGMGYRGGGGYDGKKLETSRGGASRFFNTFEWCDLDVPFFYTAKAATSEKNEGLDGPRRKVNDGRKTAIDNAFQRGETRRLNTHPTVKPIALMRWLVRLVTPPGGTILDPFVGSGTTLLAAHLEDFSAIGIEREAEYVEIARARLAAATRQQRLFETTKDVAPPGWPVGHARAGQQALFGGVK